MLYQLSYARAPSGGGRIRTFVGVKPADLQSAPFGRSGTPPSQRLGSLLGPRFPGPTDNAPRVPKARGVSCPPDNVGAVMAVMLLFGNVS